MSMVVMIPTYDRPVSLELCLQSLSFTSYNGPVWVCIDKRSPCAQKNHDIVISYRGARPLYHTKDGWSAIMNFATLEGILNQYNQFIAINDDAVISDTIWHTKVENLLKTSHMVGFCKPNTFSALAYDIDTIKQVGWWDESYIGGGYEDDDFLLRLMDRTGCKSYGELKEKGFLKIGNFAIHAPTNEGSGWVHGPNGHHFKGKWVEVDKETEGALQSRKHGWRMLRSRAVADGIDHNTAFKRIYKEGIRKPR